MKLLSTLIFILILLCSCGQKKQETVVTPWGEIADTIPTDDSFDLDDIQRNGELIALTLTGPETYYDYRGKHLGAQYLLAQKFADKLGVSLRMEVCRDSAEMLQRLEDGEADLICYPMTKKGLGWMVGDDKEDLEEELKAWYKPGMLADVKKEIGICCASLISPGQTIIMDGGSTVYSVAQRLMSKHPIVITNSLPIANLYSSYSQVEVHVTGGVIYPRLGVLTGPNAVEGFSKIHADVAIMGAGGLTLDEGVTNTHALLIDMQLAMIRAAQKVIFCMDSTKLSRRSLFFLCGASYIQTLVTDSGADPKFIKALKNKGIDVHIAGEKPAES